MKINVSIKGTQTSKWQPISKCPVNRHSSSTQINTILPALRDSLWEITTTPKLSLHMLCVKSRYTTINSCSWGKAGFYAISEVSWAARQANKVYSFISCLPGPNLQFCKLFPWSQQHSYCWWWLRQQISVSFQLYQCFPSVYRLEKIVTILTRTNELHIGICNHILM